MTTDDFEGRTDHKNVSHCQQQQSCYSGLRSPGWSYSTYLWNKFIFIVPFLFLFGDSSVAFSDFVLSAWIPTKKESEKENENKVMIKSSLNEKTKFSRKYLYVTAEDLITHSKKVVCYFDIYVDVNY